ncbi:cytochrome ubiquinol oxidase subunit I [Anaerobacillus sp. HL2]|nr:cytochrome ubiquinol oxidase subunit I [Anaerobacillus sp. HL2]
MNGSNWTNLSAFWIIAANSWQQTPAGYKQRRISRAELTSFAEAFLILQQSFAFHMLSKELILLPHFLFWQSAKHFLIKKRNIELAKSQSIKIAVVFGLIFSILQGISGHAHAALVAETQPAKLAACEAHWETEENAPLLLLQFQIMKMKQIGLKLVFQGC